MFHYRKVDNNFELVDDQTFEVLFSDPHIAVVFDKQGWILLKHGPINLIESWLNETKKKYQKAGLQDISADLTLISSIDWDVVELNKILDITGYLESFWKENVKL